MHRKFSSALGIIALGGVVSVVFHSPLSAKADSERGAPAMRPAAEDGNDDGPPGPPPRPGEGRPHPPRQRPPRVEMPSIEDLTKALNLTDEQGRAVKEAIDAADAKIDGVLTDEQRAQLKSLRERHGPPPPPPPPPGTDGADRENVGAQGAMQDEDHGRPVALVARDLGVTPEQFRAAFRKVHPAGAGQQPTEAQRRANRKVLSETLGVSPEKLDEVMDRYRPGGRGDNGPKGPPPEAPAE